MEKRYETLIVQFEQSGEDFMSKSIGSSLLLQAIQVVQRVSNPLVQDHCVKEMETMLQGM